MTEQSTITPLTEGVLSVTHRALAIDFEIERTSFEDQRVEVKAISEKGLAFFGKHFGAGAISAVLTKSGSIEFIQAISDLGLGYRFFGVVKW